MNYGNKLSKTGNRFKNEDTFRVVADKNNNRWFGIVCDGMGGHAMGEMASDTVASSISDYWEVHGNEPDSKEKVLAACVNASRALDERANKLNVRKMGTTMVMASIEDEILTIAYIGDSRCYVQRQSSGVLHRTKDHTRLSFGWEVIDKCLFSFQPKLAVPDVTQIKIQSGDKILLCSDGIYKSISPDILMARMMDDKLPEEILDVFDFLCEKSGDDNYTAILIMCEVTYIFSESK